MKVSDRLKISGYELSKANVGNAMKALVAAPTQMSDLINSYNYRQLSTGADGFWMFNVDGTGGDKYFNYNSNNSSLKAFLQCPPVSGILLQKAHAYINGETWVMDKKGKESESAEAVKIKTLFNNPNPLQNRSQFEMFVYVNTMLFGYTVILPIKPAGFENIDAKQLWAVPGNYIEIEESEDLFFSYTDLKRKVIKSVTLMYKNTRTPLNVDDIFIIKDITPSFTSIALPQSRIELLSSPINNVIGALQSRGVLIYQRGPRFAISNGGNDKMGTIPMTPDQKTEVENQFKQRFGLMANQSQAIITSASLNIASIGYDVKELGLMEEVQESSSMICFTLGFPKFLAGLSDPTFNNQETAEKALYQRFIIPESKSFYEQWNAFFNTSKYGLNIINDFSKLTVLQANKKDEASARLTLGQALDREFKNNWITYNRVLELMGEDTVSWGDVYFVQMQASGFQFGDTKSTVSVDESGNLITT